jgi:D-alanyl-D-alanine carboxypeptidase
MNRLTLLATLSACAAPTRPVDALDCTPLDTAQHPRAAELQAALDATQRELAIPGLSMAVIDDDGLWLGAAGTADAENDVPLSSCMRFPIFSVTKTFVATTILSLAEGGDLDLDARAAAYLTDEETRGLPNIDEVTIRQLIGQTSGIPDYVDTSFVLATLDAPERRWTWRQALDRVRGERPQFAPGAQFRYSNTNYLLAAAVIERITGRPQGEVVGERTFDAVDAPNTTFRADDFDMTGLVRGYFDLHGDGHLVDTTDGIALAVVAADGCIQSDAAGVAAFYRALLDEESLISPDSVVSMQDWRSTDTDPEWTSSPRLAVFDAYGLGLTRWNVNGVEGWGHGGDGFGYQAHAYTFPSRGTTFVLLANGASFVGEGSNLTAHIDDARDRLAQVALQLP